MRKLLKGRTASIGAIVVGLVLIGIVGALPDLGPAGSVPVAGERSEHARIVRSLGTDATGSPSFEVELLNGEDAGTVIVASARDASTSAAARRTEYGVGDEVVVTRFSESADEAAIITEPWRVPMLGIALLIFAMAVLIVGQLQGARSLVALALTLAVVAKIVVPLLLRGVDPVLLAVGGGVAVTVATLILTEGVSRITASAATGIFIALLLTALLAAVFTAAAGFSPLQGSEEIAFLIPLIGDQVDLQGILLAATVFGALGVLDDVSVTQASLVQQLHRTAPDRPRGAVIARAMHVGRSHIAATVNTLVLAYLGAALPLLLLFGLSGQDPLIVLNREVVAVELFRALVGSIGIVAAVPLTTLIAAWWMVPSDENAC
jgi:uncharacterized membrane protein